MFISKFLLDGLPTYLQWKKNKFILIGLKKTNKQTHGKSKYTPAFVTPLNPYT